MATIKGADQTRRDEVPFYRRLCYTEATTDRKIGSSPSSSPPRGTFPPSNRRRSGNYFWNWKDSERMILAGRPGKIELCQTFSTSPTIFSHFSSAPWSLILTWSPRSSRFGTKLFFLVRNSIRKILWAMQGIGSTRKFFIGNIQYFSMIRMNLNQLLRKYSWIKNSCVTSVFHVSMH